ncbi:Cysteine-rich receptor-like protein [Drosera capensis]
MSFISRFCGCIGNRQPAVEQGEEDGGEASELLFGLRSLQAATNFFSDSNFLGRGGFGPVFKGLMPNGEEIAVKKLSVDSRQGVKEFTNEVRLLRKAQHRNLVMLLGCCIEGPEKMLVYEYLPNRSLDYLLFAKRKVVVLDWPKRYKIITGIARGLLYLHEEAPERIIHRDIKASNILLDEQLNPKISDFGLARLFPGDDTHFNTFKISGTHGYMAPEYAMRGVVSVKTDVFSYGVLLLEIVSGRKNFDYELGSEKADLLSYAWMLFEEGKPLELVDPSLTRYSHQEIAMCIQLGLLCCQASVSHRPLMSNVNLTLSSESFNLSRPGEPGIQGRRGRVTTTTTPLTDTTGAAARSSSTACTKTSFDDCFVQYPSRNSISLSSVDEGR